MPSFKIPSLDFYGPDCPLCGAETNGNGDGWDCPDCGIWWDREGQGPERIDDEVPQCQSTYAPGDYYRCVRNEGHPEPCAGVPSDGLSSVVMNWSKSAAEVA